MELNLQFDSSINGAPAGYEAAIQTAADMLDTIIENPIVVTINVGYGEVAGTALGSSDLGEATPNGYEVSYSQLVADLGANASSPVEATFLANLPAADPNNGRMYFISTAQEKALGLISATSTEVDGSVGFSSTLPFSTDPAAGVGADDYDLVGDALHELTHALGRTMPPGQVTSMDLMAYGSNGQIDLTNGDPRYLSFNGGTTDLVNFDTTSDPGDFASGSPPNPFNAYLNPGTAYGWTSLDGQIMQALGYQVAGSTSSSDFFVQNETTGQSSYAQGQPYAGPVSGLTTEYIVNTSNTLNVTAEVPNAFIEVGYEPGQQTAPLLGSINVSVTNGNNVLDGYANSDFLTGGSGNDTFYLDVRTHTQNSWSTIENFHAGDSVTFWGVTAADFSLDWIGDTYGAAGATGLTGVLVPVTAGQPEAAVTLAGLTTADATNGRLSTSFGTIQDNNYLTIRAV